MVTITFLAEFLREDDDFSEKAVKNRSFIRVSEALIVANEERTRG